MLNQHRSKLNSRAIAASVLGIVLALSSTSALARAMVGSGDGDDDDAPGKAEACRAIGCPNGNRVCGTASGKITAGAPPFVGEIAVSWTCYEGTPSE